jgi:alpha-tubulin suppressor-like RCC1 family protein
MSGMTTQGRRQRRIRHSTSAAKRIAAGPRFAPRIVLALLAAAMLLATLSGAAAASTAGAGLGAHPDAGPVPPKVTQQPANVTVEEPGGASFTSAASNSPTIQWELSIDGGATWNPIEGATSGTYSIAATTLAESGHKFRAVFTNAGGTATSKAVTLTVTKLPVVTQQPVDANAQEGQQASFESHASGSPAPTTQWQQSTDGGATFKNLSGATQSVLHLSNLPKTADGWEFRAVFKNTAGEATSQAATLHIVELPVITIQPLDTTVIEGENATFNSGGRGNPTPSEQWEVSTDSGATWAAVPGATSSGLTVPATTVSENGYRYRAVFTNVAGSVTTNSAKLTVEGIPVVTEQPENETVSIGGTATFEAAGTGLPAPTVQWELSVNEGASWSPIAGATSTTLTVSNAQLSESGHEYRAVFKNTAGTATSLPATLTVSATNYRAYGWGLNTRGQAGVGSNETVIPSPTAIASLHFVTDVAGGPRHSLALLAGGTVESWGFNGHGQLGNEGAIGTKSPILVENLTGVKAIAAGGNHSVALLANGTVKDWGDDESGQLGDNKKVDSEVPVAVEGLSAVTAIAAGEEHTLALLSNGTVMAWGNNERGQLGTGNTKSADTPAAVKGLSGVTAIAANRNFSMALLAGGTVVTWGDDERGQLGNAAVLEEESEAIEEEGHYSPSPVPVEGLSGVTAIAAGQTHALALLGDKTVVGWGDDHEGQLGNGALEPMSVHPTPVSGLTNVAEITAGEQDSAAILESGTLMTWGMNNAGSLGIGTRGEAIDTPVQVTALGMVAGVSAGGSQMLAFGEAQPSVTAVSPASGPTSGGTEVTITGTNLGSASAVHFGASAASSFKAVSTSTVTAVAPAGTGTVDVTVATAAGTTAASSADHFTYVARPAISKLSAKGGPATGGTTVTITGTSFVAPAEVHFGEVAASSVTVNSPTSITAVSPPNVSGTLSVTVSTIGGASPASTKARFKYAPAVESVSPANGPLAGGTTVTITGAGFAVGAGVTKFKFGKGSSKSVQCASTTSCTVLVPAAATTGTVDVVATANKAKGATSESDRYTYE